MEDRYLEVTFRRGKPFAAYLYLPRQPGVKCARTEAVGHGLVVDYGPEGVPIGLEITAPGQVSLEEINGALERLGQLPLSAEEVAPLAAA